MRLPGIPAGHQLHRGAPAGQKAEAAVRAHTGRKAEENNITARSLVGHCWQNEPVNDPVKVTQL